MKMTVQLFFEIAPARRRIAWLISLASAPTTVSPTSPSSSTRGISAATESTTSTSDSAGADEGFCNVKRLLAGVRLRNEQAVDIDAEGSRVSRFERVLNVYIRCVPAVFLRGGDDMQRKRSLTGGLRPVYLDDTAARNAADAEGKVKGQGARGEAPRR